MGHKTNRLFTYIQPELYLYKKNRVEAEVSLQLMGRRPRIQNNSFMAALV